MGQAWCKERSAKAQDSKSPLDRVFVRCAHRIYPSLKEEGSVLGGATQRVTSSEIGYAGSPPREILARGRSIDSVDRPFHPSDWVDVNLEVPGPPRANLVLTNSPTVDTTTPYVLPSNIKDATPVPPPRRKKRNRDRPLPPKPDEIAENASEESLRSKTSDDHDETSERICAEDARYDGRRTKEIYEHKVNGTGRIISSDVVSGKRTSAGDKKTWRTSEPSHHRQRKVLENEEYEKFARSQSIKDSSTPNRQDRRKSQELEKRIGDSSGREDGSKPEANTRMKNYSTVSLPNYHELDLSRHPRCATGNAGEKTKSKRPVRSSTGSLPAESFLSPFSEKTSVRLEDYVPRRGSIEHLSPYQVLGKLGSSENEVTDGGFMKYDPSKLEDWDLSDISNCDSNRRASFENLPRIEIHNEPAALMTRSVDVVDYSANAESSGEAETTEVEVSCVRRDVADQRKADVDDSLADQRNSPSRYLEGPKMTRVCQVSPVREPASSSFFLDEDLHRSLMDTIGGSSCTNGDRSAGQSRLMFGRSLSNESEPYDEPYESKELRAHSDVTSQLIRTISEESLPREMLDDEEVIVDFFDEGLMKDATASSLTPPPSPEPRIKARIVDNDHSSLLKVLNDEANGSNLSSMTPSLTELEAALSDMLEKEEEPRTVPVQNESSVSLGQILGGSESKSPKTRKVSFCTWQEEMTEVDLREETAPGSNNSRVGESELPRSGCDFFECPQDGAKSRVAHVEAHRLAQNLDDAAMPTPPRRRNRSSEGGMTKEPVGTVAETHEEADPYPNDRLI